MLLAEISFLQNAVYVDPNFDSVMSFSVVSMKSFPEITPQGQR